MLLKYLSPTTGALACASFASLSSAYDWETSLELTKNEENDNPAVSASATYFFSPLNHSSATPWQETAFTDRVASFQFETGYEKQTHPFIIYSDGPSTDPNLDLDFKNTSLSATYTHQAANSPHSISAFLGYKRLSADQVNYANEFGYSPIGSPNFEYEIYSISSERLFGGIDYSYYLQDNWTVGFAAGATDGDGTDTYSLAIHTDRLWNLGNNKWAGFRAAISRESDYDSWFENWLYEIEGRYYFNERTGVSIGIELPDNSYFETYSVALHRYLTSQLSLNIGYELTKLDFPGYVPQYIDDTNSNVRLKLGYRF